MKSWIKSASRRYLPGFILNPYLSNKANKQLRRWEAAGRPVPPPHIVKQMAIADYRNKYGNSVLVETGTYLGDMVEAQRGRFDRVFSIELGDKLYERARKRFRRERKITIVHGDSGKVLPEVMARIDRPAIFWLDGHYSSGITVKGDKECPIFEELDAIFNSPADNHILLIDDARCFDGSGDYPTLSALDSYVTGKDPRYRMSVENDIIRFVKHIDFD